MPKASEQARLLWPYLLPLVEKTTRTVAGGSSGSAGAGGAPSPHALNSSHHTGTLADYQAPQFLLVDGSRTLTGNLAVDPGVMIDGVDLSAHAADPDAHHARATAGNTGISVSGQAISAALATTSGLQISSGLKVGAGDGIDVLTSTIAVDVTDIIDTAYGLYEPSANNVGINKATDSGLAFDGGGKLTLGTPSSVSVSSVNSLVGLGVSHSHAVSASSDVGTTPAAALLKSTGAGGLILATLTVKGNVDITDGGDLTVGSNVLFVDVSQDSVGILRAPDPQFALDVNGPIRGTELVGKHAIQLDDLAILLHYDGGEPYETNYTGEPNAIPMGQVPTTNDNVHYRPGKFYKAAVFGRSGTNLVTNPSFESSTSGWSIFNGGSGNLGVTRVTEDSWFGEYSAKLTWTVLDNGQFYHAPVSSASAVDYVFSVWLRASVPGDVSLRIQRDSSPFTAYGSATVAVTEEWQHFTVTTSSTPVASEPLRVAILPQESSGTIYVDGVQLEQSSRSTPYIDGSLGEGYAWSGTEHLSTSTRTNGRMVYTLSNMVSHRWSLMCWVRFFNVSPSNNYAVASINIAGGYRVNIYQSAVGLTTSVVHSGGTSFPAFYTGNFDTNTWYHVAVTWDNDRVRLYLDGALITSGAYSFDDGAPTSLWVGANTSGPQYGNVMIDDMVVSRQCLTTNRVKAIYESDAPVFATSSVFSFRATPKGLVWADEEGLWMRDADGDTVLGAYGGEAATKSWGGFTLEQGDIAFGRYGASDGGWFLFDRDGVSSKPYLSLGYADNDVISFDANGASIDGDIDVLGTVYAGDRNVVLDADGITLVAPDYASGTWDVFSNELENVVWKRSGTPIASIGAQYSSVLSTDGLILTARAHSGAVGSAIVLEAQEDDGTVRSSLWLRDTSEMIFSANQFTFNTGFIDAQRAEFEQASSIGAQPVLKLTQADASEEFIEFVGSVSGSNPINSTALGSYYGRVRVSVNGTFKWMPLYN